MKPTRSFAMLLMFILLAASVDGQEQSSESSRISKRSGKIIHDAEFVRMAKQFGEQ